MGWTFGWDSKAELVDYIKKQYDQPGDSHHKILRASLVGNNLWMAMEIVKPFGEGYEVGNRWIALYLLKGDRVQGYNGPQWGYKDLEESMGPNEVNCPLYILDMVPDPGWTYDSTPWRDQVREYHRKKNRRFTPGQHVYLPTGYNPKHFVIVSDKPLRGRIPNETAHDMAPYGQIYRLPRTALLTEAPA